MIYKIAVIVPVYNVENYIKRCIDSILEQRYTDYALILIDDGSKDGSGTICDQYSSLPNVFVIHQENRGQGSARNVGIEFVINNSSASFITFVDSDDMIHPDYLSVLYESLNKTRADISCCNYKRLHRQDNNYIIENNYKSICGMPENIWVEYLNTDSYPIGKLYPITFFENFRFPEGRIFEDTASIHLLLFQAKKIVFTDLELYYYFYNDDSTTGKDWSVKKLDALWAHRQQLKYLKKNHYKKVYDVILPRYISSLAQNINMLIKNRILFKYGYLEIIRLRFHLLIHYNVLKKCNYRKCYIIKNAFPLESKILHFFRKKSSNFKEILHIK